MLKLGREKMIVLSSSQKILIQLSESKEETQEKLAQTLNTTQSAVSKALKKLVKENLVAIEERGGTGKRKKVRLYKITDKGEKLASQLKNNLGKEEITLRSLSGHEKVINFRALNKFLTKELNRSFATIELLNSLQKDFLSVSALIQKSLRTIDFGFEIPELKHFYGREKELDKISEFMKSESKILALRGIAGIGKTYLVAKALEKYADWKIFWYRAHEFSTLQTFLKYLAEFLVTLRKSRLRAYLYSGRMDLNESLFILEEALQYDNVLLIFDDMHKMQKELVNFCAELFKILKRAEGVKAILAGRFIPSCFDRKDLVEGYVKELALEGLDREATAKLLEERGIKTIDKIYEFTKGHPLMLELVKSEETAWGDAYSFLNAEIYNKLEESEKTILGLASVFRAPFKAALFTENNLNTETVEGLVTKTLLQRSGEVYNAHDLIKSFIYNIITENDRINYHRSASEYYRSEEGELAALEAIWHSIKSLDEANALKILVANKDNFLTKGYLTELINVANGFKTTTSELLELKAQALFLHGDWNLAIDCYNKLLKHALEAKDNKTQAQVYCKLGEILTLRADYEKASDYLEKALATAESINEIPMVAYAKYHLGRISWLQGKPDRALEILNQALKLSTQKGLIQLEGKVSTDLGDAYYLRGELDKTISLFRKALRIARATNDSYEVARALHNIGGLFGVKKYYNKAIKWLEKCIKFSDKIGYVRMYGYGLVDAAENYISLGNLSRAKEYIDRAHNIFTRLNEQRMISAVYRAYGMLYRELGDFRKSITWFRKCIELAEELKDFEVLSLSYFDFGKLYKAKGNSEIAKKQFEKAFKAYKKLGNELKCREIEKELKAL